MRLGSLFVLAAMAVFTGCRDEAVPGAIAPKRHRTPPPPVVQDPEFPAFTFDGLHAPVRGAATASGRLLVTDARLKMVLRLDAATLLPDEAFRVPTEPSAIALLGGTVLVGNPERHTVDLYAAAGGTRVGSFTPGAVGYPTDIAVDAEHGLVFVLDGAARDVKVFDPGGFPLGSFGGGGLAPNQLAAPVGIAVDTSRQEVLVTDYGSPPTEKAAVKIFTYGGSYVDQISGAGSCGLLGCSGGFSRPQGLAVSPLGRVFLADALLSQVLVYDRATKTLLRTLGGYPTLHVPTDVALGANDDVLVVSILTRSAVAFRGEAAQ